MENNLLNGMENLLQDKRNKFIKDELTLSDITNNYDELGGNKNINEILKGFLDKNEPYRLSIESMYLIHKNIINEFKNLNITESESLTKQSIISQVFENISHLVAIDLKRSILDLGLTEIYDFYKDMFDFLEKKIWNVKLRTLGSSVSSSGFIEFYNVLENITFDLDDNKDCKEEDKKKIKDMFEGMKVFKEKIVPLEFDYQLRNNTDFHSKEEVENNKISSRDKLMYFSTMDFEFFFKNFLDDEIKSFLKTLEDDILKNYKSISKTVKTDEYIKISFDRNDPNNRVLANRLNSFIEKNKVELKETYFTKDAKSLNFLLRFKNPKHTELEAEVFREFMNSLLDFLTKNDKIENAKLEINNIVKELENSLREVDLLSKLEVEKPPVMNKKKKI